MSRLTFRLPCFCLLACSLVSVSSRAAFSQTFPVESAAPVLPVPVEARKASSAGKATPSNALAPASTSRVTNSDDTTGLVELPLPKQRVNAQAPPLGAAFEGIPDTGYTPASPSIAIGPYQIMQVVNGAVRTVDRLGFAPDSDNSLDNVLGVPVGGTSLYDPQCFFDHFVNRWVITATTRNSANTDSWTIIAVSKSIHALTAPATWTVYYIRNDINLPNVDTDFYGDYAKLGFDNTYFYVTTNQHDSSGVFQYSKIRLYKKADIYGAKPVTIYEFRDIREGTGVKAFSIQPAVTFGIPGKQFFASCVPGAGNSITVYTINVATRGFSRQLIPVNAWQAPQDAFQKFPGSLVDTGDARLLSAVYRNNRFYVAHTVRRATFPSAAHYIGVDTTSTPTKSLDVTIGAPTTYYYYPAISVSAGGNLGTVLNFSSITRYVGIAYTQIDLTNGFLPLAVLKEGEGPYLLNSGSGIQWGRYNGIAVDPSSPDRLWFNAMYATSNPFSWSTFVGGTSLFGGRESGTLQEAGNFARDQLIDWLKTTPVVGPALP